MSTLVTSQRMTAEEFFDWCSRPENRDRHFELDRGEVVEVSRPGERRERRRRRQAESAHAWLCDPSSCSTPRGSS